jgi:hypothetical protein
VEQFVISSHLGDRITKEREIALVIVIPDEGQKLGTGWGGREVCLPVRNILHAVVMEDLGATVTGG